MTGISLPLWLIAAALWFHIALVAVNALGRRRVFDEADYKAVDLSRRERAQRARADG